MEIYRYFAFGVARKLGLQEADAEDVAQQTLLELWKELPTFQYDRKRSFRGLVRTIVDRRARDLWRKAHRLLPGGSGPEPVGKDPLEELIEREWRKSHLIAMLDVARTRVTPSTFQAFQLNCLEGWSVERIALALGLTRDQVYQNKCRVVRLLRELYREFVEEEI